MVVMLLKTSNINRLSKRLKFHSQKDIYNLTVEHLLQPLKTTHVSRGRWVGWSGLDFRSGHFILRKKFKSFFETFWIWIKKNQVILSSDHFVSNQFGCWSLQIRINSDLNQLKSMTILKSIINLIFKYE